MISSEYPRLITADAIAPMDPAHPPLLLNAGLVLTGDTLTALDELPALRREYGNLPATHHPGLLTPGLINAHTHLELSHLSQGAPLPFPAWVERMFATFPRDAQALQALAKGSFLKGLRQSLSHGITTVGDIQRNFVTLRETYAALPHPKPRLVSFAELVGLGAMRHRLQPTLDAALAPPTHSSVLSPHHPIPALSPHAPYTVEGPSLRKVVDAALTHNLPLTMHLAELAEETPFLRDLSGPLGKEWPLMQRAGNLTPDIPLTPEGPIRWAHQWGLLNAAAKLPVLLAHVNYISDPDLFFLASFGTSVAYCPRTHEYFRHPLTHPYREMPNLGLNVCLATDSLASNPDLNVLKEAQRLAQRDALDPYTALEMITRNAAAALGLGHLVGTLSPGKQADLALFPLALPKNPPGIIDALIHTAPAPSAVYIAGEQVTLPPPPPASA